MTPTEFSEGLFLAESGSPEVTALARELVADARYPAQYVLQHYLSSTDEEARSKARNVLAELGELAIVPLAQSAPQNDMNAELWAMRTMTAELMAQRRRTASVLKDLLAVRRAAQPGVEGSAADQIPPGTRVCDLAFILMHRLLHLEASPSTFFAMTVADRDKGIVEFQKSRPFRYAFERQS